MRSAVGSDYKDRTSLKSYFTRSFITSSVWPFSYLHHYHSSPTSSATSSVATQKKSQNATLRPDSRLVIPLGFEPKTHALEGRCSNPTELRNQTECKSNKFYRNLQILGNFLLLNYIFQLPASFHPHLPEPAESLHPKTQIQNLHRALTGTDCADPHPDGFSDALRYGYNNPVRYLP